MSSFAKRCVLALALAVMPLQGIAAVLTVLLCHGEAHMHAVHDGHDHSAANADHQHEHAAHQDGNQASAQDEGSAGNASYHLCCNLSASAPPAVVLPGALPDFPVQAFAPAPMHDLFIPDRPQRPPLA